jgi:hypothetical protein
MEKGLHSMQTQRQVEVSILLSDITSFMQGKVRKDREYHYIKGTIQNNIIIVDI